MLIAAISQRRQNRAAQRVRLDVYGGRLVRRHEGSRAHEHPLITLAMRVARTALLQHGRQKTRRKSKVRNALRALKSFELTFGGVAALKIEVDAAPGVADSGILAEDLRDLVVAVGQAAEAAGLGFALILDELQNATKEEYQALIMALHRTKQKALPVVFVGGGLPLLPALTTDAKSYAEHMSSFQRSGRLHRQRPAARSCSPRNARECAGTRTLSGVCSNSPRATRSFFRSTAGACGARTTSRRSRARDVEAAQPVVEAHLDEEFL